MRVTGNAPDGGVLVASKHMSMWDTLALYLLLDDPGIVLKRELLYIPFYGWYLWKAAAIAIDRGAGASAVLQNDPTRAKKVIAAGRPILIFPEGTRKQPGAAARLQAAGVAAIYGLLGVALHAGGAGFGTLLERFLEVSRHHHPCFPGRHFPRPETCSLHGDTGSPHRKCGDRPAMHKAQ